MLEFLGIYFWIILIVQSIIFGFATSYIAGEKNKDKTTWFFVGFFLGFIGLIMIAASEVGVEREKNNYKGKEFIEGEIDYNKFKENKTFNMTVDFSSPIDVLWNSIIVHDDKVKLYSDFKNVSKHKIVSIIFDVECFNSFDKLVNEKEASMFEKTIQDLDLLPGNTLNEKIYLDLDEYPSTRKVNLIIKSVLFDNGDTWNYNKDNIIVTELNIIKNQEDLNIIRKLYGEDIVSIFEMKDDRWICICGRNNGINCEKCFRCNRLKDDMILKFSNKGIEETIKEYESKKELERKLIMEKKAKEEELVKENKSRNKKRMTIAIVIILIITGTMVGVKYYNEFSANKEADLLDEFFIAVDNLDYDRTKLLLEKGIDINAKNDNGETAFFQVFTNSNGEEMIEILLAYGADINAKNDDGETVLFQVVTNSNAEEMLKFLLENGADINAKKNNGETALFRAVRNPNGKEIIKMLLDNGVDINIRNDNGYTVLDSAKLYFDKDKIEMLIENGAQ